MTPDSMRNLLLWLITLILTTTGVTIILGLIVITHDLTSICIRVALKGSSCG